MTLAGMAKRTLQLHTTKFPQLFPPREVLSFKSDRDNVYYNISPNFVVRSSRPAQRSNVEKLVDRVPPPAPKAAPVVQAERVTVITNIVSDQVASDIPSVNSLDVIRVLLAVKLKKPILEIQDENAIKDLVGGKSAIQNEIGKR